MTSLITSSLIIISSGAGILYGYMRGSLIARDLAADEQVVLANPKLRPEPPAAQWWLGALAAARDRAELSQVARLIEKRKQQELELRFGIQKREEEERRRGGEGEEGGEDKDRTSPADSSSEAD